MSARSASSFARTPTWAAASVGWWSARPAAARACCCARSANDKGVGEQGAGRVFLFLETDDFERDHGRMEEAGVQFLEPPRHEAYGTVAIFEDLYGNRWDLIEPLKT